VVEPAQPCVDADDGAVDAALLHELGPEAGAAAFPGADLDDELGIERVKDLLHHLASAAALQVQGITAEVEAVVGTGRMKPREDGCRELAHGIPFRKGLK
jgi:hypothetical protein